MPLQQQQQARPDLEATALRWLEMSANRPKRHHAPERRKALAHHYHQAHQEILTVSGSVWVNGPL